MSRLAGGALPTATALAAAGAGCAALLVAAGQPIFTDDLWWHLGLGRAFAAGGPRLAEDPLLFAAAGPPPPASWLADVGLSALSQHVGFGALRALHVAAVAAILAGVFGLLRRESRSASLAAAGVLAFVALAAYRLVQLRPELVTIGAALCLHRFVLAPHDPLSVRRIALFAALAALWANLHAGFPLAVLLPAAAAAGLLAATPFREAAARSAERARARRLALASGAALLASFANPLGPRAHLAVLVAGERTPALEIVGDEWAPLSLFALPAPPGPPSPLAWALVWAIGLGGIALLARAGVGAPGRRAHDPALVAVSLAAFALLVGAVRFLWLGIFPLLLFARALAPSRDATRPRAAWAIAAAAGLLLAGFPTRGDWPAITRGLPRDARGYAEPYPAAKYPTRAIWLLRDSGVRGRLYTDYHVGGFAGYWLAPAVRTLTNGSLNVPRETLDAAIALAQRRGLRPGGDFETLLDDVGIDLFLGAGLPEARLLTRGWNATTAHLEGVPGWIPVFRDLGSALYLRAGPGADEPLARLARYYAERDVPFDPESGFAVDRVLARAGEWAARHGVVPLGFSRSARIAERGAAARHAPLRGRVATVYALLGLYGQAIALDRRTLAGDPEAVGVRRRLVWSLLRAGSLEEAARVAAPLAARPEDDGLSRWIARVADEVRSEDPQLARARIARLPLLSDAEVAWLRAESAAPPARPARGGPHAEGAQPPAADSSAAAAAAASS